MKLVLPTTLAFVVVPGFDGRTGFVNLGIGTISPATFKGATINSLYSEGGVRDVVFSIIAGPGIPQNYFKQICLRAGSAIGVNTICLRSADAASFTSFGGGGGLTTWQWGTGANPVWSVLDTGAAKPVTFVLEIP